MAWRARLGTDEITRVSRQNSSGTYAYFGEAVMGKGRDYKLGSIDQSGSKDVVALVANTPGAIGYSGMGYVTPGVKMLKISAQGRAGHCTDHGKRQEEERLSHHPAAVDLHGGRTDQGKVKELPGLDSWTKAKARGWWSNWVTCPSATMSSINRSDRPAPAGLAAGGSSPLAVTWRLDRTEPAMEWLVRLCGWSAILFIFAIFLFVLREAAPVLFGKLNLVEFFTSPEWRPTSEPSRSTDPGPAGRAPGRHRPGHAAGRAPGIRRGCLRLRILRRQAQGTLKILIELLAAIPSVVWGFVGYMVLGPIIIRLTANRSASICSTAASSSP